MFDPTRLLDQMMGAQTTAKNRLDQMSGSQGFAGGAIAGGLLGMMLGGRRRGGLMGYGGAAALGALAYRAYQNYQQQQAARTITGAEIAQVPAAQLPHAKPAAGGGAFELVLIEAMVGAAKSDGHVDAQEQQRLFGEVERLGLDASAKAYVFDLLSKPTDLNRIAASVTNPEQASELYLAARLAIDPDKVEERAYLEALAARLQLPNELREHLDKQVTPP